MSWAEEESRATLYQQQLVARVRAENARRRALAGSRAARQQLASNWKPIDDWIAERDSGVPDLGHERPADS